MKWSQRNVVADPERSEKMGFSFCHLQISADSVEKVVPLAAGRQDCFDCFVSEGTLQNPLPVFVGSQRGIQVRSIWQPKIVVLVAKCAQLPR